MVNSNEGAILQQKRVDLIDSVYQGRVGELAPELPAGIPAKESRRTDQRSSYIQRHIGSGREARGETCTLPC